MSTITTEEAVRLIYQSGGRAFAATFTKRTNGSLRTMRCRLGVHKPPFPAHSHGHPTQEPPPMWRFVYVYSDVASFSFQEPKQLLLHRTKRSHGCQRVHIVAPLHDLSALDGNDRDEPVVV